MMQCLIHINMLTCFFSTYFDTQARTWNALWHTAFLINHFPVVIHKIDVILLRFGK